LRSGWLSRFGQTTFEAFLEPLAELAWPTLAVLSDKQKGLPEAVALRSPVQTQKAPVQSLSPAIIQIGLWPTPSSPNCPVIRATC